MLQVYVEIYKELKKMKRTIEGIVRESQDLKQIERFSSTNPLKKFFTPTRTSFLVSGLVAETEKVYTGLETSLGRLVKYVDGNLPEGADWHKRLIDIAADENPGTRPPIIDPATMRLLDDLRSFRHKTRHVYEAEIDRDTAIKMSENAVKVYSQFLDNVSNFHRLLEPGLPEETLRNLVETLRLDSGPERE